jgi:hypothetical protein
LLEVGDLSCDAFVNPLLLNVVEVLRLQDPEKGSYERAERVASFIDADSWGPQMSEDVHPLDE